MELPFKVDLTGRTAVVTGGGGVLCGAFARALARCGARVAVLDLKIENAQGVVSAIHASGGTALAVQADVLSAESLKAAEERVRAEFGPCSLLINGAGGNHPKGTTSREYFNPSDAGAGPDTVTFFDLDPAGVEFVFRLNFIGTLVPTQVFARGMIGAKGASIINVSSMNAFRPLTKIPAYSGAKAAVSNFTQWLAVHFSKAGIRVNAIAPGFFLTEQNRTLLMNADGMFTPRAATILAHTPMGRFGNADDLIGTLLWLADEKASGFVNGTVIPVDGGFAAFAGV
ncbi:MAG: SDR family oxidoreductase [Spirochaetes bacterium]|nr:MAG: SDR family oxidoreductase [Spirochaetota bacterium]